MMMVSDDIIIHELTTILQECIVSGVDRHILPSHLFVNVPCNVRKLPARSRHGHFMSPLVLIACQKLRSSNESEADVQSETMKYAHAIVKLANSKATKCTFSCAIPGYVNVTMHAAVPPIVVAQRRNAPIATTTVTKQFKVIGYIRSCFSEKHGTPRQGSVSPSSRGRLDFCDPLSVDPQWALWNSSHVWILFVFHLNTNTTFHAKVRPPRLNGLKVGVLSTRSPHRPNPIGCTVARIEGITRDTDSQYISSVHISGIDIVDGTPVVSIRSHHSQSDSAPSPIRYPQWLNTTPMSPMKVVVCDEAMKSLRELTKHLEYFSCVDDILNAVKEGLSLDSRSLLSKKSHGDGLFGIAIDRLDVVYRVFVQQQLIRVERVSLACVTPDGHRVRMRTDKWLKAMQSSLTSS